MSARNTKHKKFRRMTRKFLESQQGKELKYHLDRARKWRIYAFIVLAAAVIELAYIIFRGWI